MILALECGALTLQNVTQWADVLILKEDDPDHRLFDVSVSKSTNQALNALTQFGVSNDTKHIAKYAFSLFLTALENNTTSYEKVSFKVYQMAFKPIPLLPNEKAEIEMIRFYDDLEIANEGIYGDAQKIKNEMLVFLKHYAS